MRVRGKLFLLLATLAIAAPLSACQSTTTEQGKSLLDTIQESKTIKIGILDGAPPYSQLGANGEPEGYDVDIAKAVAETLGATPKWTVVDIPGRVTSLQTKQLDMVVADFTRTPKRAMSIDFTVPYLIVRNMFLVRADSPFQTVADINKPEVRIAITRGGTAEQWVPKFAPNGTQVAFNAEGDCVQAVQSTRRTSSLRTTSSTPKSWPTTPACSESSTGTTRRVDLHRSAAGRREVGPLARHLGRRVQCLRGERRVVHEVDRL